MFRADSEKRFSGPHQTQHVEVAGKDPEQAHGAMILIHGRGATAQSILTLTNELDAPNLYYVAPQASGHQWYPNSFLAPIDRNEPGLSSGLQMVHDIVTTLEKTGIPREKIILAGFSQGACLASEYAARHPSRFGGLVALSGGLIGDTVSADNYSGSLKNTPVFLGCSNIDPHIPKERVDETETILMDLGAKVTKKIYKGMGHTVNEDEIEHVKNIIQDVTDA